MIGRIIGWLIALAGAVVVAVGGRWLVVYAPGALQFVGQALVVTAGLVAIVCIVAAMLAVIDANAHSAPPRD